ncbi:uncharacterized protein [Branchiostoma lanceolatum]|uniref:uncharacterized protein n=1 Tax=Branchiostoma lanceolatum TaxID=7740 RepID=UPI0034545024
MAKMTMIIAFLTLACLFTGWPDAGAQGADEFKEELATLRENIQGAIELEWATIPPYLTAWLSIKDGTNKEVRDMLHGILMDEMYHMAMAANLLNAIGGEPVLNDPDSAPSYPGQLPAGALPKLNVTLEKMSRAHTKKVFMGIETPECEESVIKFFPHLSIASNTNERSQNSEDAFLELSAKCDEEHYSPDTIGAIYIHKILCPLKTLEDEAKKRGDTIFNGEPGRQISFSGQAYKVSDLSTAIKAVDLILSEGEGGDPCNPYVDDNKKETCHYYKFAEIVRGREVNVTYGDNNCPSDDPGCDDFFSPCDGSVCEDEIAFSGLKVPFDESGVYPIIFNPSTELYPPDSEARDLSDEFNKVYTDLMLCLHEAVNGYPEKMGHCKSLMRTLRDKGKKMVKEPIIPGGDPYFGPNVAPTYEFNYGAQEQQQHTEF